MNSAGGIIALVPMKGHSERVPNKNLRSFGGRPLYQHIMGALIRCPCITSICVNTDSDPLEKEIRKSFGERVRIIRRPSAICGDFVPMNTLIHHDLSQVDGKYFLQTHSTNPLLKPETVSKAADRFLKEGDHDSLFGVNRFQSRFYDDRGRPINHDPDKLLRTQDLPPVYEENSSLYLFSRESFAKTGRRIGTAPILFEVPKMEAIDIDTEEDFNLAEVLYEHITQT